MNQLALFGGTPVAEILKEKPYQWPQLHPEDEAAVVNALRQGHWGGLADESHPQTKFERQFSAYHDARYGVLVANGTISLELSMRAGGIRPGDEVIVPAITFIASATSIVSVGAVPVFVDVDTATCQISAAAIEAAITPRTKAVIVVHFGGYPVDLDTILPLARKHGLLVIEDCAHAQGTAWRGRRVGSWGDFGSVSFQQSKGLSAGEGGIVLVNDEQTYEQARLIRNIGRKPGDSTYYHYVSASNWRLGGLQSALLLSQFSRLPEQAEQRHRNYLALVEGLEGVEGIACLPADERITQYGCYFAVLDFDAGAFGCTRQQFVDAVRAEGVYWCTTGYNRPLYKEKAFTRENLAPLLHDSLSIPDYAALELPNAERWASRMVTILHFYMLGHGDGIAHVLRAIHKVKSRVGEFAAAANDRAVTAI